MWRGVCRSDVGSVPAAGQPACVVSRGQKSCTVCDDFPVARCWATATGYCVLDASLAFLSLSNRHVAVAPVVLRALLLAAHFPLLLPLSTVSGVQGCHA